MKARTTHKINSSKALYLLLVLIAMIQLPVLSFGQGTSSADSLKFPISDDGKPGAMDLADPANVKRSVEYDEKENKYYFVEKVGDQYVRNPTYMTQEEYQKFRADQDENSYWRRRMDALTMFNKKPELPTMYKEGLFDRIFGGTGIQVRPQGNVDVTLGGNWQNIKNPALTQRQQKYGVFNFDLQMNINLLATIGDKVKLNISNNTKATFDFQNMQRVEYTGKEDEIIKKIEAGNTSFPLKSTLLSGRQSLFGIKTQLQFGKLWVTTVLSQQKSKQNSLTLQGGAQTQQFTIKADGYEENRNFLLAHYFRDNYNKTLSSFPVINSLVTINKLEVWIANRNGAVTGVRSVVAFMDLGEKNPYNKNLIPGAVPLNLPDNSANDLYSRLQQYPSARQQGGYANVLNNNLGLQQSLDYSAVTARKLTPSEYSFNPQLGYVSINAQANPDDVIGVAFRYTYNGKVYQVGEFAEDLPPDTTNQRIIFLKLLKGTTANPKLPIWDLMMKNVYALGGFGLSRDNFRLNVLYQDPGGGEKRYLPEGASAGIPLLTVLNLDRLNQQNDPGPDGVFDFVEGLTINTQQGKIIFPVLEPFGSDLLPAIGPDPVLQRKYPYQILYDSTKTVALQSQQNNRFVMRGSYKSATSSEISLGGFNIPQGSVQVTAGGQRLVENQDYQIDYGLGRLKILNTGILNSGIPINVQYEDNATFGFLQQNFMGSRFDYILNEKLTLGGTFMRLTERPFTQKTNIGEDPIKNTNLGLDASYQSEFPLLTRALDKLPIYSTTTNSFVTASGEVAGLFPGHSKVIDGVDPGGTVYIDDFEGTRSSFDLKFPIQGWNIASTPVGARGSNGSLLFPEATLDTLAYGYNRAKLAWYMVEPTLIDPLSGGIPAYVKNDPDQHYIRMVQLQEIFPQTSYNSLQNAISTLDLSYYPQERGPYNFDANNIDPATGRLLNPKQRWAGITRYIDNTDFEQSNVEFIEMWMMDPFINGRSVSPGGSLYINLGDISEDVLKDHNLAFENGITNPKNLQQLTATRWGYVPTFALQITRAFDNDPAARSLQDVGFDLLSNDEEKEKFQWFLTSLAAKVGATSATYLNANNDPANDDYQFFRGNGLDDAPVLQRYKRYNNMQGNSPITDPNSAFSSAATTIPESEDLNRDNTLNEAENYYQYRIDLAPNMQVGSNFITSIYDNPSVILPNGNKEPERWYQFKIPINEFQNKVGNINDFRSIRFMRMYLNGFEDSTTLRFARLQLGRNTWRRYLYSLLVPGENIPIDNSSTSFNLLSVSVEENSKREPIPYVIPPGVTRQQQAVSNGQTIQQNEQSISLQMCNLKDGDSRGVFKSVGGIDLRQFDKLRLFTHSEAQVGQTSLQNGDLEMFLRIGSDFTNNYYEYRRPLNVTAAGSKSQEEIWPKSNELELVLNDLVAIKTRRNDKNIPPFQPYQETLPNGTTIVVVGQPNIGEAKNMMLGVINPKKDNSRPSDDGLPKCGEVWFDELRVSGLSDRAAYAAAGKVNIQMADLGSVRMGGMMNTAGYGSIDQKINQRSQNSTYTYDVSSNLNMGKLMPKNWGVSLPFFIGYSQNVSSPKYNPYDLDQKMDDLLNATSDPAKRDSFRRAAQDFTSISSFNIANARIMGNSKNTKTKFYGIKNFDFSYSYNKQFKHNSMIEKDDYTTQTFGVGYTYSFKPKSFEPFKKLIKSKSKWLSLVKEFNFNVKPSNVTFRNDMNRVLNETQVRVVGDGNYKISPTYFKNFIWTRSYNLRWDLTRSLSFDYNATNRSRVDEPSGRIDNASKRDSLWNNVSKLGRNTQFTQGFNASYTLPLSKLPITDWTSMKITYGSTYAWTKASLLAENLGNVITNTQQKQINGELNFAQLYNKNRWLKAVNQPAGMKGNNGQVLGGKNGIDRLGAGGSVNLRNKDIAGGGQTPGVSTVENLNAPGSNQKDTTIVAKPKKRTAQGYIPRVIDLTGYSDKQIDSVKKVQEAEAIAFRKAEALKKKKEKIAARLARRNSVPDLSGAERFGGKLITMVKRATINYSESGGTILPGFMDSTQLLGVSSTGSPGLGYAFGYQPNLPWLEQMGKDGKLSRDTLFNAQFSQTYSQNINLTAQVEPISDLRIDITLNRTFNKTHSELFKDTSYRANPDFQHLTPYQTGSFTQSYNGLSTMFKPSSVSTGAFLQFIESRPTISKRLGNNNPYTNGALDPIDRNYAKGYTAYSQEVLIPAFIAAYTGQDANSVPLLDYSDHNKLNSNPFKFYLPKPNWRITYNGLSKLPVFKKLFNNIVVTSTYNGTLSMNSFNSSLAYNDLIGVGFPSFIDSNSGNFVPYFQVPNITISDQLNPLFSIDLALKNNMTTRFELKRSRLVSLSLIDYQVSETKSLEYVFGLGYKVRGLKLPFPIFGKKVLENDLNIKVDVGLRDDKTTNTYLANKQDVVSRGQKVLTISPTIDYLVSQSLTLRFFYNRSQTIPYVSNSFPITTSSGGLTLRFMFAQ